LTKHLHEEVTSKLHLQLEDADKLLTEDVDFLDSETLSICRVKPAHVHAKPSAVAIKSRKSPKTCIPKIKMEKTMTKLYNLENEETPEKTLNLQLDVDLYQMEDY
jgi:hypothetical protein